MKTTLTHMCGRARACTRAFSTYSLFLSSVTVRYSVKIRTKKGGLINMGDGRAFLLLLGVVLVLWGACYVVVPYL